MGQVLLAVLDEVDPVLPRAFYRNLMEVPFPQGSLSSYRVPVVPRPLPDMHLVARDGKPFVCWRSRFRLRRNHPDVPVPVVAFTANSINCDDSAASGAGTWVTHGWGSLGTSLGIEGTRFARFERATCQQGKRCDRSYRQRRA